MEILQNSVSSMKQEKNIGYPTAAWEYHPGCEPIERWADQLHQASKKTTRSFDDLRLTGVAAIVEHDYPRNVESLSSLIAARLALPCRSIDPEHESLPEIDSARQSWLEGVLFLQPGNWQEAVADAGNPRSDTVVGRVRTLLEQNFKSPTFIIVSSCREVEDIHPPLRRITGLSRVFELPIPSPEELGKLFIRSCDRQWLSREIHDSPRRVGLLLQGCHDGYEGRALARLFAQRVACLEGRQVTLKDLAVLDSVGIVESSRILPSKDGFAERVAWHEAGHAAIAMADSLGGHIPEYVTIIPRRGTLGHVTLSRELCERRQLAYTRAMMIHDLRVTLAGRVVEEIIYGDAEVSDLSANDLELAATTLKTGVLKYGLQFASKLPALPAFRGDSTTGDSVFAQLTSTRPWRTYLEREYEIATQIAVRYRSLIEVIQQRLIAERVLFRDDLEAMWRSHSEKEQHLCQAAA
jgi:hypothetical protein